MIKILLVDDHKITLAALDCLLSNTSDIEVVDKTYLVEESFLLHKKHHPDVVIVDVEMPGVGGFGATVTLLQNKLLHSKTPPKVLLIGNDSNFLIPAYLIRLGARGYVSKISPANELECAIRSVYSGNYYVDAALLGHTYDACLMPELSQLLDSPFAKLSERELQVVLMVVRGMDLAEIADKLHLSEKTISGYRTDAFNILGVHTNVKLTLLAIQHNLVNVYSDWH